MDWREISEYFRRLPRKFNYLLIIQFAPLLFLSALLIKEISPRSYNSQLFQYLLAAFVLIVFSYIPWNRILWWFAPVFYIVTILMLGLVNQSQYGATRWFHLPGTPLTIQPSELMKISVILMLAYLIKQYPPGEKGYGFTKFSMLSVVILIPFYLIFKEPDLGTALVMLISGFGLLFMVHVNWKIWVAILVLALPGSYLAYKFMLKPYQIKRIHDALYKPSYQVQQALIAIGSGGLKGKSEEDATQTKLQFLPIATSDFIFAYLGERFGFTGMLTVIGVYILLIVHLLRISNIYSSNYLIVSVSSGFAFLLFVYMSVNTLMVIGLAPVVGLPLPMFSHGGTSLIIFTAFLGILINLIAVESYIEYNADAKLSLMSKDPIERSRARSARRRKIRNSNIV